MDFDITIIGGGIVGLAIAAELSARFGNILLIEKNHSFGMSTSSRNSEVLHAGMYYPRDSLKAKFCVEGNRLIYEWCERFGVPFRKIGKYIIGVDTADEEQLLNLEKQGRDNGVKSLQLISKSEFRVTEPCIKAEMALFSPETGIVDSHTLMQSFESFALNNGVTFAWNHSLENILKTSAGYELNISYKNENFKVSTAILINSAGLSSDKVAEMAGIDISSERYKLTFAKGHYFRLIPSLDHLANHLIYPAPAVNWTGIGIHITKDLNGSIKFGPDIRYMNDNYENYSFDASILPQFIESIRRYAPSVKENFLHPDQVGIRPKLQKPQEDFRDFIIREESDRNLKGLWNLIGIESPGLTSCLAIAKFIASSL